jgi:hypothetical protein
MSRSRLCDELSAMNGANGISDIEHVAIGNGAFGGSDIEGKAAMGSGE